MVTETTTSGGAVTYYVRSVPWRDTTIFMMAPNPCQHRDGLAVMHHYDDAGHHYCPTGFLYCPDCMGLAEEPPPYTCTRWEE